MKTTSETKALLCDRDCAALVGVARSTWWTWSALGHVPRPLKIGRTCRWRRNEIMAWIEAGCPGRARWEEMKGGRR